MAEKNDWLDRVIRDQGTYRYTHHFTDDDTPIVEKSLCNSNDYEDALIEALDAGMDAEEIADILLGSIS